jgi:hypothetical protein
MNDSPEIIRLTKQQAKGAAAVLARAFHNDPLMHYLMPVKTLPSVKRYVKLRFASSCTL